MKHNQLILSKLKEYDLDTKVVFTKNNTTYNLGYGYYEVDNILVLFKSKGSDTITVGDFLGFMSYCCYSSEGEYFCEDFKVSLSTEEGWDDDNVGFNSLLEIDYFQYNMQSKVLTLKTKEFSSNSEIISTLKVISENKIPEELIAKIQSLCMNYDIECIKTK